LLICESKATQHMSGSRSSLPSPLVSFVKLRVRFRAHSKLAIPLQLIGLG